MPKTPEDLAEDLAACVLDSRGVELRQGANPPWAIWYPARDAHLPWCWLLSPATPTQPARVMVQHAGALPSAATIADVAAIMGAIRRWLMLEPTPAATEQGTLL